MVMADVTRTGELDKMAAWRMDWTAKWGGEPFWRATAALDMEPMAREAGFVDVRGYHPQPGRDPYVIYGRDRKSVVTGKSVSVRVDLGGRRTINKKNITNTKTNSTI